MIVSTRICDLCNEEMTDYIPQVQILGKPRGGWKMTGYSDFNDVCPKCHDAILEKVLSLRVKGAAFRVNGKDEPDYIYPKDKTPQYKRHQVKV